MSKFSKAAFLITDAKPLKRETITDNFTHDQYEEVTLEITLISSGDCTVFRSNDLALKIMDKLKVVKY